MKVLVDEVSGEGLEKLLGEFVTVYCDSWIYYGKLTGVNTSDIKLSNAMIVYDTGGHDDLKKWGTAERLPGDWYIRTNKIESFGIFKQVK